MNAFRLTMYFYNIPITDFLPKKVHTSPINNLTSLFFIRCYFFYFATKYSRRYTTHLKGPYSPFNYLIIKDTRKQPFTTLLNTRKVTKVTYSTGLLLCVLGFKRHNMYRPLKKHSRGFSKAMRFAKAYVLPKFFRGSKVIKYKLGLVIRGRGRFAPELAELPRYFNKLNTSTLFFLWHPKVPFSFSKLRQYGRIKRNFRKRIVRATVTYNRK